MWPRVVEIMFGAWLLMSPFIFGHPADASAQWATDFGCGALLITLALISYVPQTAQAHWFSVLIGCWLCGFGYFGSADPPSPAVQNNLLMGLNVLMFAILPNNAAQPPAAWSEIFCQEASNR